jgi:hypothetical protein
MTLAASPSRSASAGAIAILHINHWPPGQASRAGEVVSGPLALIEAGRRDVRVLPSLRVHLDWIQYRANFREPVTIRRAADLAGVPLALAEVFIDLRRAEPARLAADLDRALLAIAPEVPDTGDRLRGRLKGLATVGTLRRIT